MSMEITAYQAATQYLAQLDPLAKAAAAEYSGQLQRNGNKAFRCGEFAGTLTVPLLASAESTTAHLLTSLSPSAAETEYAFAISANIPGKKPTKAGLRQIKQNWEDVMDYASSSNAAPTSAFFTAYPIGQSIGTIMRDLNAASLSHTVSVQGPSMANMPIIRCDADLVTATPTYPTDLRENWEMLDRPAKLIFPRVTHEQLDPVRFPNLNRLFRWIDTHIQEERLGMCGHFGVDIIGYCVSGGLLPSDIINELGALRDRMIKHPDLPGPSSLFMRESVICVSSRRIARSSVKEGCSKYDALLVPDPSQPNHYTDPVQEDLTDHAYQELVKDRIRNAVYSHGHARYQLVKRLAGRSEASVGAVRLSMHRFGLEKFDELGESPELLPFLAEMVAAWQPTEG